MRFKCRALRKAKMPPHTFVAGRHVMTCCVEDIQFAGFACSWDGAESMKNDSWMILTAKVNWKFSRAYGHKGPVLTYIEHTECEAPADPVATFY